MTATRAQALAARRVTVERRTSIETRREAHRVLRAARGADAARLARTACSAAIMPAQEFADVDNWRAFLEPLYPEWAVELGVALFDSERVVVLEVDQPPRARSRPDDKHLDLDYFAAGGYVGTDGLWKLEPGSPLADEGEPAWLAQCAAVVARCDATRARVRALQGRQA